MNVTFTPFPEIGLVAITTASPTEQLPSHVRVIDIQLLRPVRRLALSSARRNITSPDHDVIEAHLDALIRLAQHDLGHHECGGA